QLIGVGVRFSVDTITRKVLAMAKHARPLGEPPRVLPTAIVYSGAGMNVRAREQSTDALVRQGSAQRSHNLPGAAMTSDIEVKLICELLRGRGIRSEYAL